MAKIKIQDTEVTIIQVNDEDYLSLTDMIRAKDGDFFVTDWLRNRNTLEYIGLWEEVCNPIFNYGEFATIKSHSGLNSFKISVKEFVAKTNAISLQAKAGRYGGTFAHKDVAFEFAMWISPGFKIYLVKEFQRMKAAEQKQLGWSVKRVGKDQLPHPYRCHQREPDPSRADATTKISGLCRRSRCVERGAIRDDSQTVAGCPPRPEGQHSRLRHHQPANLSVESRKLELGVRFRRHSAKRTPRQVEQNRHPPDANTGGDGGTEDAEMIVACGAIRISCLWHATHQKKHLANENDQ